MNRTPHETMVEESVMYSSADPVPSRTEALLGSKFHLFSPLRACAFGLTGQNPIALCSP